jgi:uncharacterized protein (TIGR02145 family)
MNNLKIVVLLFMSMLANAQVIPVGFMKKSGIPPTLGSTEVLKFGLTTATIKGNITSNGGGAIVASGICYSSTMISPTLADNVTTDGGSFGVFTSALTSLSQNTTYYVRAYSTNSSGTSYGTTVSFSTYGTVVTRTGRTWLDRNLGASRVAQSSTDALAYGDYFQWGRPADGHEKVAANGTTADFTNVRSATSAPSHSMVIAPNDGSYDWLATPDNSLWSGVNAANNPCPTGFRLPTVSEWYAEAAKFSPANVNGTFEPTFGLRMTMAGSAFGLNTFLPNAFYPAKGNYGQYLTQTAYTVYNTNRIGAVHYFGVNGSNYWDDTNYKKSHGMSVRCILN